MTSGASDFPKFYSYLTHLTQMGTHKELLLWGTAGIVLNLSTTKLIYNSLHTTISTPRYTITIRWR